MQYIRGIEHYHGNDELAITLGKFDGLHLGHQALIQCMKTEASTKLKSMVFAFDMSRFRKEGRISARQIMLDCERQTHLKQQVDYLLECPFTEEIQHMKAETFISEILVERLHAKVVVVGSDFRFGYQQKGDSELLKMYADELGYKVRVIEKELYQGREISSTYIKEAIGIGDLKLANNLLGYHYSIEGEVIHGNKLGRTLGFPTMNIQPDTQKLLPPNGVYVCKVVIDDEGYYGIGNVGCKPTVSDEDRIQLEVHLFGFSKEYYGKRIQVELLEFIRSERCFGSVDGLKKQIGEDMVFAKKYVYNR